MPERALLNYTTRVPAKRTIGELQDMLAQAGADAVIVVYASKRPIGIQFALETPAGQRTFRLPAQLDGIRRVMAGIDPAKARKGPTYFTAEEHVMDVGWRILRAWVEAQLAIIDAGMVSLDEVMLPYLLVGEQGQSLYEAYRTRTMALPGGTA